MSFQRAIQNRQDYRTGVLSEVEEQQLATAASDAEIQGSGGRTIAELFEAQVIRTPHAPAVRFELQQLTYIELNRRANQLAHHLQRLGVGSDTPVGICLPRSLEMAVAVLAVIKAGNAYLPLDPTYPKDRLRYMLADSHSPIILTRQTLTELFAELPARILDLDLLQGAVNPCDDHNLQRPIQPDNLAYIMYTSGSTGEPKGVAMPHRALVNLICWHRQHPLLSQPAVTLQFSALSFDVSFQELFSTWCTGGELVLMADSIRRDLFAVWKFIQQERIERIFAPFIALQHLAELIAENTQTRCRLKQIVTAGEQLLVTDAIRRSLTHLKGCTLHNQYGPTEAHVVSEYILTGEPATWPTIAPIGRPIDNVSLVVLDEQMQPTAPGISGDLYIGGEALATGYIHHPGRTAERFIPAPQDAKAGARLYRTGDVACWQTDGNLLFLGRKDQQVKVRGVRVELGEIEAALAQHPAVSACAVSIREENPGNRRLAAYWVARDRSQATAGELRAHLQKTLPDYMIPASIEQLNALPLSPVGKVDRDALARLTHAALSVADDHPRTPVEKILTEIWSDVLQAPMIGIHDNYFEMGGDSILAIRIATRAKQHGLRITPGLLMEHPTISQLAAMTGADAAMQAEQSVAPDGPTRTPESRRRGSSDFPNAGLDQQELDDLLAEIRELEAQGR
jgi:amino acid adenylation domain-containing protein